MDAERRWYGGHWEFTGEHGLLLPVRVVEQGNGCGAGPENAGCGVLPVVTLQVNCLVRTHLGIKDSKRIQG